MKVFVALIFFGSCFGCATSPTQVRLEQNFVYNCYLVLLAKNIAPGEVEKLCTSAHRSEMEEKKLQMTITAAGGSMSTPVEQAQSQESKISASLDAASSSQNDLQTTQSVNTPNPVNDSTLADREPAQAPVANVKHGTQKQEIEKKDKH